MKKKREKFKTKIIDVKAISFASMTNVNEKNEIWKSFNKMIKSNDNVDENESKYETFKILNETSKFKRKRKNSKIEQKTSNKKSKMSKTIKTKKITNSNIEKIKRFQSWFVKCEIRKMWYKKLQSYVTSNVKIYYLKNMLFETEMIDKYSTKKTNQIKKKRKLKIDFDVVQVDNKQWNMKKFEKNDNIKSKKKLIKCLKKKCEKDDNIKSKKKLIKCLQKFDFFNDDDKKKSN